MNRNAQAISRLTALWAFTECGLGGALHAIRMPFTGIFAGGLALIFLTMLAHFSNRKPQVLLKSLLIVLAIKAALSPHSPFPAYLAVSFQGLLAAVIFGLFPIRRLSIMAVCLLSMWESALQKLLLLVFFFGNDLLQAFDEWASLASKSLGFELGHASSILATVYISIYTLAALVVAWMTYRFIHQAHSSFETDTPNPNFSFTTFSEKSKQKSILSKIIPWLLLSILLSLFFYLPTSASGPAMVLKPLIRSFSAILGWFIFIDPFLSFLTKKLVRNKSGAWAMEIETALGYFPFFKWVARSAWQASENKSGWARISAFLHLFVWWALTLEIPHTSKP